MTKFNNKIYFFSFVVFFLIIFNIAIFLMIPIVQQIFGLIALCFFPGFLLCSLFKIKVKDIYENFLYSVGLSLIFSLLFGLFINSLLPILGYVYPLSTQNLQFCYSIIILIVALLIVNSSDVPSLTFKIPRILKIEKIFLIFGFIILLFVILGIYLVNANITNLVLIFSILLIPLLLFLLIFFVDNSIKRIYPIIIYLISFSLLMLITLRSNYIIGVDTNEEYFIFHSILLQSFWVPDPTLLLSAALSISIVPAVFGNFLNIDSQLLFKLLFPLIFSIVPVVVYVIAKNYLIELFALFASCLFIFQQGFIYTTVLARTSLAILFFAFAILVLINQELPNRQKYLLFLLFITGAVFSHYTTALIFFLITVVIYLIEITLSKFESRKGNRIINFPILIFFLVLFFLWYDLIINQVFQTGLQFTITHVNIFHDLYQNDIGKYIQPPIVNPTFLLKFTNYSRFALYFLIGIGILFECYNWIITERKNKSIQNVKMKVDRTFLFIGVVALGLLICTTFTPFLFIGYDTGRVEELLFIILPVFLIIGAEKIFDIFIGQNNFFIKKIEIFEKIENLQFYCQSHKNKIISVILLFLLVPQLLFITGVTKQFDNGPYSIILNSPKYSKNANQLEFSYIFDQDAKALQWYKNNSLKNAQIFSDDFGNKKITGLLNQHSTLYQKSLLDLNEQDLSNNYIFITVTSEYYKSFFDVDLEETKISSLEYILNKKNKIFTNGAILYE